MRTMIGVALIAVLGMTGAALAAQPVGETALFRLASVKDLAGYPRLVVPGETDVRLFVILLPETDLALVLRPISEWEYGSFQVRAVGYQIIEWEMLAAAVVLPVLEPGDLAALPPELILFLKRAVNGISGFTVFDVPEP